MNTVKENPNLLGKRKWNVPYLGMIRSRIALYFPMQASIKRIPNVMKCSVIRENSIAVKYLFFCIAIAPALLYFPPPTWGIPALTAM